MTDPNPAPGRMSGNAHPDHLDVSLLPPSLLAQPPTFPQLTAALEGRLAAADIEQIRRAYRFAAQAHDGQQRETGEPYLNHPLAVALILMEMCPFDPEILIAALLHDVLEDCPVSRDDLASEFGEPVAALVDGVTKLTAPPLGTGPGSAADTPASGNVRTQQQAQTLRKMVLAMCEDIRVGLIKLADRLHNMRTLDVSPSEKQKRMAQQTREVYVPLANQLGIWGIKRELEDLAFYFLERGQYLALAAFLKRRRAALDLYVERVLAALHKHFSEAGVVAQLSGRTRHIYSLHQRMRRQNQPAQRISDLVTIQVITQHVRACYTVLGVVHTLWPPIPGEVSDQIGAPQKSFYRSLDTAVWAIDRKPLHIQIRTSEMAEMAEFGVAAHWRNRASATDRDRVHKAAIADLRRQLGWRHDVQDPQEFVDILHSDIFQDHICVYTPRGEPVGLPSGATPVDFAYYIHTELGHHCSGARVNGHAVTLDAPLGDGDHVQILKDVQRKGPDRAWLSSERTYVTTATAQAKIRQWFRRQPRIENVLHGGVILQQELEKLGHPPPSEAAILAHFRYPTYGDLLEAIGNTTISPAELATRLAPPLERLAVPRVQIMPGSGEPAFWAAASTGTIQTPLARCCQPRPGDEIFGDVTRGQVIIIHQATCRNIGKRDPSRLVKAAWYGVDSPRYLEQVRIVALDRVGLLMDVVMKVAGENINIQDVDPSSNGPGSTRLVDMTLEVSGMDQLLRIIARIKGVHGVYKVDRLSQQGPGQTRPAPGPG